MLRGKWKRKLKKNFVNFTVLPKAGPADFSAQKGKTKSYTLKRKFAAWEDLN